MEGMLMFPTWLIIITLPVCVNSQVKWEHICSSDTKEVSCSLGSILEVVHIYHAYREAGCTNTLTGSVDDVANCSQISNVESNQLNDIHRRCNMTNACNITAFQGSPLFVCPQLSIPRNNIESYSYKCNPGSVVISSATDQPSTRAVEGRINATDITTCSSECPKPDNDQYTAGVVAGATVGGLVAGFVIGIIGTIMLIAYKRKEPGQLWCLKLKPEDEVINEPRLSANRAPGESSARDYYNMDQSEPTLQSVNVTSQVSNDGESNYDVINQQEQGIREYDSLQQNDYINRQDDNQYEAMRNTSTRTN